MGTLNSCWPVSRPVSPPPQGMDELAGVEDSRAALKEGPALGVPTQEKTAEVPVPVEVVAVNVTPHIDG
jgi:hypothetical protein